MLPDFLIHSPMFGKRGQGMERGTIAQTLKGGGKDQKGGKGKKKW